MPQMGIRDYMLDAYDGNLTDDDFVDLVKSNRAVYLHVLGEQGTCTCYYCDRWAYIRGSRHKRWEERENERMERHEYAGPHQHMSGVAA